MFQLNELVCFSLTLVCYYGSVLYCMKKVLSKKGRAAVLQCSYSTVHKFSWFKVISNERLVMYHGPGIFPLRRKCVTYLGATFQLI